MSSGKRKHIPVLLLALGVVAMLVYSGSIPGVFAKEGASETPAYTQPESGENVAADAADTYTITYKANEGSGSDITQEVSSGKEWTSKGSVFTRDGYSQTSWNTKADGTGAEFSLEQTQTYNKSENLVLYAIWAPHTLTIRYHNDGAEQLNWDNKIQELGNADVTVSMESKYGERFVNGEFGLYDRWRWKKTGYTENTNLWKIGKSGVVVSGDNINPPTTVHMAELLGVLDDLKKGDAIVELYPVWIANTYRIAYEANIDGATGSMANSEHTYDQVKELSPNGYSKDGYIFTGWNTKKDGTGDSYSDKQQVMNLTTEDKAVVSLYAQWVECDLTATAAPGQHFDAFKGDSAVTISGDDAFTVQFDMSNLKTDAYDTVPTLNFGEALPEGTTIIMQTGDSYWYIRTSQSSSIKLTDFEQMGAGADRKFEYKPSEKQFYRFVIDFSQASKSATDCNVSLSYEPTGVSGTLSKGIELKKTEKTAVKVETSGQSLAISAPSANDANRWSHKNQVLVLAPSDTAKLPSDALLSASVSGITTTYTVNQDGKFIIPLTWSESQAVSFSLSSSDESVAGKVFQLTALLYAGPTRESAQDKLVGAIEGSELASSDLSLSLPSLSAPSLKLIGDNRVFDLGGSTQLELSVDSKNLDGASVSATVEKKDDSGSYGGTYLTISNITDGKQVFSLNDIKEAGSYRLLATVTKDSQTVFEVPYYFVVK